MAININTLNSVAKRKDSYYHLLKAVKTKKKKGINRLEIIDHTKSLEQGGGRAYVKWEDKPFVVEFSYQDNNRTLKIFLSEAELDIDDGLSGDDKIGIK